MKKTLKNKNIKIVPAEQERIMRKREHFYDEKKIEEENKLPKNKILKMIDRPTSLLSFYDSLSLEYNNLVLEPGTAIILFEKLLEIEPNILITIMPIEFKNYKPYLIDQKTFFKDWKNIGEKDHLIRCVYAVISKGLDFVISLLEDKSYEFVSKAITFFMIKPMHYLWRLSTIIKSNDSKSYHMARIELYQSLYVCREVILLAPMWDKGENNMCNIIEKLFKLKGYKHPYTEISIPNT